MRRAGVVARGHVRGREHDCGGDPRLGRDPGRSGPDVRDAGGAGEQQAARMGGPAGGRGGGAAAQQQLRGVRLSRLPQFRGSGGRWGGAAGGLQRDDGGPAAGRGGLPGRGRGRGGPEGGAAAVRGRVGRGGAACGLLRGPKLRRGRGGERRRQGVRVGVPGLRGLRRRLRLRRHLDERDRPARGGGGEVHCLRRLRGRLSAGAVHDPAAGRAPAGAVPQPAGG